MYNHCALKWRPQCFLEGILHSWKGIFVHHIRKYVKLKLCILIYICIISHTNLFDGEPP
jgi:hypothetical protein